MVQKEINKAKKPCVLLIFDGFGYRKKIDGNAVALAHMPMWRWLQHNYPHTLLKAAGRSVGLPDGFMGNSEVGHITLGAGRPIMTTLCQFHDSIVDKTFFSNKLLLEKFTQLKKGRIHFLGLLSDAGVHSHEQHLYALLRLAKHTGIKNAFVHAFLDGRDVPPRSSAIYLKRLQNFFRTEQYGKLASIHGRFYAMDRNNNWDRIQKSYELLCGKGLSGDEVNRSWHEVLDDCYRCDVTDEFIEPVLLNSQGVIQKGDGLFFFNFRPDRMRQLTKCFLDPSFNKFDTYGLTPVNETLSFVISTTQYDKEFEPFDNDVLFKPETIFNTLLDEISQQTNQRKNRKIFIIAETEKYAHVTYFFRGKVDVKLSNETRVLIPSLKVKTYAEHPDMSAHEITKQVVMSLQTDPAYFYLINYANCDMVGHSGNFDATVRACECLDKQLKILYEEVVETLGGTIFFTADHGNAEEMVEAGKPKTAHTSNPVPFMIIGKSFSGTYKTFDEKTPEAKQGLSCVAPTILAHLGLTIPDVMDRISDLVESHFLC